MERAREPKPMVAVWGFRYGTNVDLMLGIDGDTPQTFLASFEEAVALGPDEITVWVQKPVTDQAAWHFDETMARIWEGIARFRRAGGGAADALYLLPNAKSLRYTESADLLNLRHKAAMRLCYNAQEEIWRLTLEEVRQIGERHPGIGPYLLPPCGLRRLAAGIDESRSGLSDERERRQARSRTQVRRLDGPSRPDGEGSLGSGAKPPSPGRRAGGRSAPGSGSDHTRPTPGAGIQPGASARRWAVPCAGGARHGAPGAQNCPAVAGSSSTSRPTARAT